MLDMLILLLLNLLRAVKSDTLFDNSQNNINGTQIEHGWIYEFEVYEHVGTNFPPVADVVESYQDR